MPDFWRNCGFHLLDRDGDGRLALTDDFLRAYLLRPEIAPVAEFCAAERALHADLIRDPRQDVPADRVTGVADADARENYQVLTSFFQRLIRAETLEACYSGIFQGASVAVPGLFIDHLAEAILRGVLDETPHPMWARAAELFFRAQTVTITDGAIVVADAETVAMGGVSGAGGPGQLLAGGARAREVELDVINEANAGTYWERSERHDLALDIGFLQPGLDALCRVLEAWVRHFLDVRVNIQPLAKIDDDHWVWHVGLDAEATALLNDLYNATEMDNSRRQRLLSLFRLEFEDPGLMRADVAGRPVYLGLAMSAGHEVRLKPQNLLGNLPLAREA